MFQQFVWQLRSCGSYFFLRLEVDGKREMKGGGEISSGVNKYSEYSGGANEMTLVRCGEIASTE